MKEEEMKYVCKFCGRSFSKVRALCGHMRAHRNLTPKNSHKIQEFQPGFQEKKPRNYVFREKPKKFKEKSGKRNLCVQCGRGFKSSKAMFGHKRLHSRKDVEFLAKGFEVPNNHPREKRSVRRYKIANSSWSSLINACVATTCSSSVSNVVIDGEDELLEIASCLLVLSKGGFHSANNFDVDSHGLVTSDCWNGVEFACNGVGKGDGDDHVVEGGRIMDAAKVFDVLGSGFEKVLELQDFDCNIPVFKSSDGTDNDGDRIDDILVADSGLKSDVLRCGYVSSKKKIGECQGFNSGKSITRPLDVECGVSFDVRHELKVSDSEIRAESVEVLPEESMLGSPLVPETFGSVLEGSRCLQNLAHISSNEPQVCAKSFQSGQGLGGHWLHCGSFKSECPDKTAALAENSVKTEVVACQELKSASEVPVDSVVDDRKRAGRKYTCLVCCKVFTSGQALGGHMRAHFSRNPQTSVKGNDACENEIHVASEEPRSNHHVSQTHTLAALVPVA